MDAFVTRGGDDPHNLRRYTKQQEADHPRALRELRNGRKAGCWSWWILPTPPFIRNGQRVGSSTNWKYELKDDDEGLAYLKFGSLRKNYLEIMQAANEQLAAGTPPRKLLGIDVPRFEASAAYFRKLAQLSGDRDLHRACARAHALLHPEDAAEEDAADEGAAGEGAAEEVAAKDADATQPRQAQRATPACEARASSSAGEAVDDQAESSSPVEGPRSSEQHAASAAATIGHDEGSDEGSDGRKAADTESLEQQRKRPCRE
jgi:uncharacterized protein (DUF1810 family)